jgi:hypothetical protein
MSMLCNCCVRELLILARTCFAFGLPSKTGCDILTKRCFQKVCDEGYSPSSPCEWDDQGLLGLGEGLR